MENLFLKPSSGITLLSDGSSITLLNVGVAGAFGLLHSLLYAFYPRERANLFFGLFAIGIAVQILVSDVITSAADNIASSIILNCADAATIALAVYAFLQFLYAAFGQRTPRHFWIVAAAWLLLTFGQAVYQQTTKFPLSELLLVCFVAVESPRIIIRALRKPYDGAWIVGVGVLLLVLTPLKEALTIATNTELPRFWDLLTDQLSFYGIIIANSVYLARNFARTNKHLEEQLVQVRELSTKQLEQQRGRAAERLHHQQEHARFQLIAAENDRRAKELEEARQLQLSMLPKKLPSLPQLEIAAYMQPATEVGGDYYDFHLAEDGTLTVAVGDATGHGLRAGTMVTATKSLFNAYASEPSITRIFMQTSQALKRMNLRGLYMAIVMVKIKGGGLSVSAAGMPPMLVYRAATTEVEEVAIKALPLGSVADFPYQQQDLTLSVGDIVVLMSDGFAERFNEAGEMLDYAQAKMVLAEEVTHSASAQEIINHFVEVGDRWGGARPQDDDVTFVVLKMVGSNASY